MFSSLSLYWAALFREIDVAPEYLVWHRADISWPRRDCVTGKWISGSVWRVYSNSTWRYRDRPETDEEWEARQW